MTGGLLSPPSPWVAVTWVGDQMILGWIYRLKGKQRASESAQTEINIMALQVPATRATLALSVRSGIERNFKF